MGAVSSKIAEWLTLCSRVSVVTKHCHRRIVGTDLSTDTHIMKSVDGKTKTTQLQAPLTRYVARQNDTSVCGVAYTSGFKKLWLDVKFPKTDFSNYSVGEFWHISWEFYIHQIFRFTYQFYSCVSEWFAYANIIRSPVKKCMQSHTPGDSKRNILDWIHQFVFYVTSVWYYQVKTKLLRQWILCALGDNTASQTEPAAITYLSRLLSWIPLRHTSAFL